MEKVKSECKEMTAYFDPRGCDFWPDQKYISDVGNYRILTCVIAKNGEPLIIEFGGWERREDYITKSGNKKTRVANHNALYVNACHTLYVERPENLYGPDAGCYGFDCECLGVDEKNYDYTRADILRFLSDITGELYTEFIFDREKVDSAIEEIYKPVERAICDKASAEREKLRLEREKDIADLKKSLSEKLAARRDSRA